MNTYQNIIDKKPQKDEHNKIPSGAICGNGDLAVIFDDEKDDLILHISKCDFWKFAYLYGADGGIKTVGSIRIGNVGLDDYYLSQDFKSGRINCKFGSVSAEVFVAPDNVIYLEISAPDDSRYPSFDIEIPDTCASKNYTYSDNGIKWYLRKFDGKGVERESDAVVCCRRMETDRTDGIKTVRYCIAVVTNFDDEQYISKGFSLVIAADYVKAKNITEKYWNEFFSASKVTLPDKQIEKHYNASLYLLAVCMGNRAFPPGLYGNFITDDFYPWSGDYHLNYNYEAPYYCVFSSNHPELADGYLQPLTDMIDKGKYFAEKINCKGIYLPTSFGPKGIELYNYKDLKEPEILFLGQKSNAAYAAVIPIMQWYSTYDKKTAADKIFPYLKEVGEFWESFLIKEKDRYIIMKDAIHEVPYYEGDSFNPKRHKKEIYAKNCLLSLGLVRMLFKALIDISREIDTDTDKIPVWQDILDSVSDYPTFIKHGKRCFRYTEQGISWVKNNSLCIQHIYPASQIGLSSDKRTLKIARNTYFINDRRLDDNGSVSYLPCGARLGVDPDFLIDGIKMNIEKFALPNMLFRHGGGCLEHSATIPATINEMLMQSFEGVIRLFPCWNKKENASFENLRADGAFLVSAAVKNGKINSVRIKSLAGRKCRIEIPDGMKIDLRDEKGKKVKHKKIDNYIEFATEKNIFYSI